MLTQQDFLTDLAPRSWMLSSSHEFRPVGLFIGKGTSAIEVAVARSSARPSRTALLGTWKARRAGRATPVLLVVLHRDGASFCGPAGENPPIYLQMAVGQVERLCREAIRQPDRHAALQFLAQALPSLETALPGLNNAGLLALHELQHGAPRRTDWASAGRKAAGVVGRHGQDLLHSLGFQVERLDNLTKLLRSGDRRTALAVLLLETESPEVGTARFNSLSPVSYALAKADAENLPWVILVQGNRLRLYATSIGTGVGRRGRTETYIECQPSLLADEDLAYLWLLYSSQALASDGSLSQLLNNSHRFAGDLADQLRERIYDSVVPVLAQGIAEQRNLKQPTSAELERTYEMALTVLFRLLFVAYAEDRDLLPYRFNEAYRRRSLKQKAQELAEFVAEKKAITDGSNHWHETQLLWQAVADGNREWGVPAYNGGLFSDNPEVSPIGAELANLTLPNSAFETALRGLLVVDTVEDVPGPVDFRSLGIREFGTIYEGLLESELALAATDLSLKKQNGNYVYVPASSNDDITIQAGEVYLHNRSGVRKSSGSYYTKQFAVEHLLDRALEPALKDHFSRLAEMDDADAAEAFFNFRVADIAMGSGHFLITAIDQIEKGMADFLVQRDLPGVRRQLSSLREAAREQLGEMAETATVEDGQLLRRMIARRCVYGVDLNALSVQLARLAVWIHTFVQGLPLSVLDHNLVRGNSLVGVGTIEDIQCKFEETDRPLFPVDAKSLLGKAAKPLNRLANINDASLKDVEESRRAIREVGEAIAETKSLCDLIAANVTYSFEHWEPGKDDPLTVRAIQKARQELLGLHPLHFPVAFPEVFLRRRPGFDAIIGNPPWDKLRFEPQQFWVTRSPGLNALPATKRSDAIEELRKARPLDASLELQEKKTRERLQGMVNSAYRLHGRGSHGHHDAAKLFTERALVLLSQGGRIGYVLPRTALVLGGWSDLRRACFSGSHVTLLQARNRKGWLFDDIDSRIMVVLLTSAKRKAASSDTRLHIWPGVTSRRELERVSPKSSVQLNGSELQELSDTWVVPWFSGSNDKEPFEKMREHPRLGEQDGWIRAVADSSRWDFSGSGPHGHFAREQIFDDCWKVLMTRHVRPFRIVRDLPFNRIVPEASKLAGLNLGLARVSGQAVLWEDHPTIIYRYPTMANNTRTVIAAVLPEIGFFYSKGYVHGLRTYPTNAHSLLALLAYLNSYLADWWCRRFVDRHVTKPVLSNLPLPDWNEDFQRQAHGFASALVFRGGISSLPGGTPVRAPELLQSASENDIQVAIEALSFRGFGLNETHWDVIADDFTHTACPENLRKRIHKAIEHGIDDLPAGHLQSSDIAN